MFGCHEKYHFPENDFQLTTIFTFDPEIIYSPHFHFKSLPGLAKRRERERKNRKHNTRARERTNERDQKMVPDQDRDRRRDLVKRRSQR